VSAQVSFRRRRDQRLTDTPRNPPLRAARQIES